MNNTDINMPITLAQCNALLMGSDVSTDTPFTALAWLELQPGSPFNTALTNNSHAH